MNDVRERASRRGILLGKWLDCWSRPDPPPGVVIGFGRTDADDLPEALTALADLLRT